MSSKSNFIPIDDDEQFKLLREAHKILQDLKYENLFKDKPITFIYDAAVNSLETLIVEERIRRGDMKRR